MHILVTNDDGPPSAQSSPYILPFVRTLERAGHTVSVIIPDTQRSWIGKAHIVGQDVRTTAYWPPAATPPEHEPSAHTAPPAALPSAPSSSEEDPQLLQQQHQQHPWVLVNSTPAGCAQLGLSHFFQERGPVELVVSGPNYGRNTTAVFALSSGTLGAALEASVCGYRAVALSFAFFDRRNDAAAVAEACEQGVRVCEWLGTNGGGSSSSDNNNNNSSSTSSGTRDLWPDGQLYSVNVPVQVGVSGRPVRWTRMLQNRWRRGACFEELPLAAAVDDAASEEARLRRQESRGAGEDSSSGAATPASQVSRQRHFKWAPRFTDVYDSVQAAGPGSDGWAVKEGETSITALKANFMHADGFEGEVKL